MHIVSKISSPAAERLDFYDLSECLKSVSPESLPGVEVVLTPQGVGLVGAAAHFQPTWINCAAPIVCGHSHGTAARGV